MHNRAQPNRTGRIALALIAVGMLALLPACAWSNHRRYYAAQVQYAPPQPQGAVVVEGPHYYSPSRAELQRAAGASYRDDMVIDAVPTGEPRVINPTPRYNPDDLNNSGAPGVAARGGQAFDDAERNWKDNPDPFATPAPADPTVTTPPTQPTQPTQPTGPAVTAPENPQDPATSEPVTQPDAVPAGPPVAPKLEVVGVVFGRVMLRDADSRELIKTTAGSTMLKVGDVFEFGGHKWRIETLPSADTPDADPTISLVEPEPQPEVVTPPGVSDPVTAEPATPTDPTNPDAGTTDTTDPAPVKPEEPAPAPKDPRTLTLQNVQEMRSAGLGDSTIIAVINASVIDIDIAPANIIEMSRTGLSESVIQAIVSRVTAQEK